MSEAVGQNRRSLLKRGFILAAGAVGLGAVTRDANAQLDRSLETGKEVSLHGRRWRLETSGRRPGEAIQPGDHGVVHGELLDGPKGRVVGQFFGSRLAFVPMPGARATAGVEVHTFVLTGGTIVGMGTSLPGRSVFAVVGGTGAYAGATGSYAAIQRLREQGGNGTAEFKLSLRA
jgi:hypothetical protein